MKNNIAIVVGFSVAVGAFLGVRFNETLQPAHDWISSTSASIFEKGKDKAGEISKR